MSNDHRELLTADPARTGIFLDFDGTLSDIVHVPSDARPIEGAREVLEELAEVFGLVAIVSGRSADELLQWLGPEVEVWGTHGAQRSRNGKVELSERAAPFAELMARVRAEASEKVEALGLEGVIVEDKTIMVGLHFRNAEDVEAARRALDEIASDLCDRHGLRRAGGRLAYELRPPEEFTKAAVVLDRSREADLAAAAFFGDDLVDLPAFDALDALAEEGRRTVRVGVDSDEAPPAIVERADIVVDGPQGALKLLRDLIALGRASTG